MLIAKWARGKAIYRKSAALAMDQIDKDGPSSTVRRQIAAWSRSGRPTEQDTAARWYGLRIEQNDVSDAVTALRDLGARPELRHSNSIAEAMSRLFLDGNVDLVLDELGRWIASDGPYLSHHSVRALLMLADENGAGARPWPRLSELVRQDDIRQEALIRMWRRALTSHTTGDRSWESMRKWLTAADRDPELAVLMESLAARIFTDQLARRALFNLTLWHKRRPGADLIRRIHHNLADALRS
jgi:hypothetical protein